MFTKYFQPPTGTIIGGANNEMMTNHLHSLEKLIFNENMNFYKKVEELT